MCDIPIQVDDTENVVRAIFSHHLDKKDRLTRYAFKEPNDDLSVMRHTHMDSDQCKKRALEIRPGNPKITYKGLAVIGVKEVRSVRSEVTDTREGNYCGHARLSNGLLIPPPDDPLAAEKTLELNERLDALRHLARYYADLHPTSQGWGDGEIL